MLNNVFPFVSVTSNSFISKSLLILFGTNNEIASTPNGSNTLLTAKSTKSKNVFPKTFTSLITPNDRAHGIPTAKMSNPIINDAEGRFFSLSFATDATTISSIEIAEVKVAKKNKIKNIIKKNCPNGIFANTAGRTMNNKPGPSVGLTPTRRSPGKSLVRQAL